MNLHFSPFPLLSTERLLLRPLQSKDAEAIFILRSDENINKYLDRPKAKTIADAQQFIQKITDGIAHNESFFWALTIKADDLLAGTICLWNIDVANNNAEIGYELLPEYQGKGLMQEAIQKVIAFGFDEIQLQSIEACVHKENKASVKLLEKNNFSINAKKENDSAGDMMIYSLST
ncbi:MAG: GNAT family N-acetyltransferase [Panacibacter sp.]